MKDLYTTPPMQVGKHQWRAVVYRNESGINDVRYEWRVLGLPAWAPWQQMAEWRINRHTVPSKLKRLYAVNLTEIMEAMN